LPEAIAIGRMEMPDKVPNKPGGKKDKGTNKPKDPGGGKKKKKK
jgi:hypothetical protein